MNRAERQAINRAGGDDAPVGAGSVCEAHSPMLSRIAVRRYPERRSADGLYAGFCPGAEAPWIAIHLGRASPRASSDQPGQRGGDPLPPKEQPTLFDLATSGACRAAPVARGAVSSYLTVSSFLRRSGEVCFLWRFPSGFPGRALPGAVSPCRPDVPHHKGAAIRPSARSGDTLSRAASQDRAAPDAPSRI